MDVFNFDVDQYIIGIYVSIEHGMNLFIINLF